MTKNINCASLLYDLKSSTPENLDFFQDFIDNEFYKKILDLEELTPAEKYILFIEKIANTLPCDNDSELFVSLIARQSQNIEKCIIDKNEKIFNALNFLFDTYKKANIKISFEEIIASDNFIGRLLRMLQENFKEEIEECKRTNLPEEKIENLKKVFETNFEKIIQKIKSFIYSDVKTLPPAYEPCEIDSNSIKMLIDENLNEFKKSLLNLIDEKLESNNNFDCSEINFEFPTTKLDVINENIMKLKEEMSEIITSEIKNQIEPILNVKDELKQTSEKLLENISDSIMSLNKTVSEIQNLAIQINDIQKTTNYISPLLDEIQKTILDIDKTIEDEVKKADELEAQLNKK